MLAAAAVVFMILNPGGGRKKRSIPYKKSANFNVETGSALISRLLDQLAGWGSKFDFFTIYHAMCLVVKQICSFENTYM